MFASFNKFAAVIRMQDLRRAPEYEDLERVWSACKQNRGKYVVLSFQTPTGSSFCLRAMLAGNTSDMATKRLAERPNEPEWAFVRGADIEKNVAWAHQSGDMALIVNLIHSELAGEAKVVAPADTHQKLSPVGKTTGSFAAPAFAESTAVLPPVEPSRPAPVPAPAAATAALQAEPTGKVSGVTLAGDLTEVELPNVLQSIQLCKMSGGLLVRTDLQQAAIYFGEGEIVDAILECGFVTGTSQDLRGEHAFLDVLTWKQGTFSFDPARLATRTTITRKSYALLMEGAMLRDYCDQLEKQGITADTRFFQCQPPLSDEEFDRELKAGLPLDVELQRTYYRALANGGCLHDLLTQDPRPKAVWAPVIFNLLSLSLVLPQCVKEEAAPQAETFPLDEEGNFERELCRPDTAMVTFAALTYFINQELKRSRKTGRPCSVILFEVRCRNGATQEALSNDALRECSKRFGSVMGELDVIGHCRMFDFALLLPESPIADGDGLLEACTKLLTARPLPGVKEKEDLQITASLYTAQAGRLVLAHRKRHTAG